MQWVWKYTHKRNFVYSDDILWMPFNLVIDIEIWNFPLNLPQGWGVVVVVITVVVDGAVVVIPGMDVESLKDIEVDKPEVVESIDEVEGSIEVDNPELVDAKEVEISKVVAELVEVEITLVVVTSQTPIFPEVNFLTPSCQITSCPSFWSSA